MADPLRPSRGPAENKASKVRPPSAGRGRVCTITTLLRGMAGGPGGAARPIFAAIERKLTDALRPVRLAVTNESHLHAGHSGNPSGAPDAETHFRVEVVSAEFQGLAAVKRHRLVYGLLKDEMQTPDRPVGIHALALKTRTPEEAGVA